MAAFYDFKREDGTWVVKMFPFGQCPDEIVDDDGVKAKRGWRPESLPSINWKDGKAPEATLKARNERRRRDNEAAGNRGKGEWRERTPNLKFG